MIFEVPSFTDCKDMIGTKFKKMGHDPDHAQLGGSLSPKG